MKTFDELGQIFQTVLARNNAVADILEAMVKNRSYQTDPEKYRDLSEYRAELYGMMKMINIARNKNKVVDINNETYNKHENL